MNNLRSIKIYELKGKVHSIESTIIDLLDGIEIEEYGHYKAYRKNGLLYFSFFVKTNNLYVYSNLYDLLKCSKEEKVVIMKYLLEKHLKIKIDEVW